MSRFVKPESDEHEPLQPAMDAAEAGSGVPTAETVPFSDGIGIHSFPKGSNAGVCLHEMLEKLDFATEASVQEEMLAQILARYGFEETHLPAVIAMSDKCRNTRLYRESLSEIDAARRLPEMEFLLYMQDFRLEEIKSWFASDEAGLPPVCIRAAQDLNFKDLQGYLKGFIDMVCQESDGRVCIIDYKSNYLGADESAYTEEAMNDAVAHHHYYLQAFIYAIAVARYFQARGKPLNEISIRYLFLRGLDGENGGIWKWDLKTENLKNWLQVQDEEKI